MPPPPPPPPPPKLNNDPPPPLAPIQHLAPIPVALPTVPTSPSTPAAPTLTVTSSPDDSSIPEEGEEGDTVSQASEVLASPDSPANVAVDEPEPDIDLPFATTPSRPAPTVKKFVNGDEGLQKLISYNLPGFRLGIRKEVSGVVFFTVPSFKTPA